MVICSFRQNAYAIYEAQGFPKISPSDDLDQFVAAAKDADALLILTDWAEFAALDLNRLNQTLRYPIIIDGRNLYDPDIMVKHGFTYLSIGRPAAYPVRDVASVSSVR